ncbi:tetratricopeptide repeat protein [Massilia scottii]|uniref:tetratricopeptide repeat protein n=1 Tax=Massilia scottii TaxID=3057166 RepID=UPI00279695E5|nr:hypothetical protein [Massilia sp. CCM 9029]MDQ1829855.1 hypothetical protein [Massilia sp. CCM 9029]
MTPMYPELSSWSDLPRLNADQFFAIFPLAGQACEADESEFYDGDVDDLEFIVINGNVSISREQLDEMTAVLDDDWTLRIAVDGHAQVDGGADPLFAVKGDLHCSWLGIDRSWDSYSVHGRVYARDCVFVSASDEGWMRTLPATRIDTPFLFLWNYKPDTIDLNPDAVMFVLGFEWWGSTLPNRCYAHKDIVYVLDSRFLTPFTCEYTEEAVIDSGAILRALAAGESIYRAGFNVRCAQATDAAWAAMKEGEHRLAYFHYKQAVAIWPDSYPARAGMADAMRAESAYAQAFDLYLEASKRFPPEQTGLVNDALNMAARIALRLGWLDRAHALATQSIDFTRVSEWDDKLLTDAWWIRGETCIAQGDMAAAQRDLEQSLRFDQGAPQPNWLMGQLCFRRGDLEQARAFHAKAARRWSGTAYYDVADTYIEGFNPVSVDWDQLDPATVLPA